MKILCSCTVPTGTIEWKVYGVPWLIFSNDASGYYHGICEAEGLDYEISKVMMQRRLTEIAQSQNHMMLAFAWVPDRALDLLSSNAFSDYTRENLWEDIHTYIEARGPMNSPDWDYMRIVFGGILFCVCDENRQRLCGRGTALCRDSGWHGQK